MRVAVTGTTGRVGRALADGLRDRHEVIELPRHEWDLAASDIIDRIGRLAFDVLLHPAAITSLEACEDDPPLAWRVNAELPVALAEICARQGRRMVHFSTDYVIGGDAPGLYGEDSPRTPRSVYAETKASSETGVIAHGGCVVRVSWVFGPEKPAFPDKIVAAALAGEPLAGIADKTSRPCYTRDLVGWVDALLGAGCPARVFHACNGGAPTSWHGMACEVVDHLLARGVLTDRPGIAEQRLGDVAAFRAERPRHTAMATGALERVLGAPPRDWREALREHIDDLLERAAAGEQSR